MSYQSKTSLSQKIILILFGFFLSFIVLEIGLRAGGVLLFFLQENRNKIYLQQKGTYRIMCVGESTTALGGKDSYPSQLENILNQRNIGIKFSVINKGIGASNTVTILYDLEENLNTYNPDMVVAMMGINDCAGHMPDWNASYRKTPLLHGSFKSYNLIRYLWLHISAKAKEMAGLFRRERERDAAAPLEKSHLAQGNFYVSSGNSYLNQGEYVKAEELFKKALEINPGEGEAAILLGRCYHGQKKYALAEESFKKAIKLNSENSYLYFFLGETYREQHNYAQAKELYEKAVALDSENHSAWTGLWRVYAFYGEYGRAEESIRKFMELNRKKGKEGLGYFNLILLYIDQITNGATQANQPEKLKALISDCTNCVTIPNYRKLKAVLDQRGIKFVCVQYPVLSIEPLKKIFEKQEGVIFVDNESLFKKEISKNGFKEYFTDKFGGGFGHCTLRGNQILAENVAEVIIKEHFHRQGKF